MHNNRKHSAKRTNNKPTQELTCDVSVIAENAKLLLFLLKNLSPGILKYPVISVLETKYLVFNCKAAL